MDKFNRHQAQYTRSLIEASLDPLVTISAKGKITDVNEASIKVIGITREHLIGTDFSDYFTEPEKARLGYQQVFDKGFVSDYPLTILHKNGNLTDVLYNASLYKDEDGKVLGVFAAARDVTEQKWAIDLRIANKELAFQNNEKEKRAAELEIANQELAFQNNEKENRANELIVANKELAFQNDEKEKRAAELAIANKELAFQNNEKENRANELIVANKELAFQNDEKEKRAAELAIANQELAFQNNEKENRANELIVANKELAFQNDEKEKRAAELAIANKELAFQNNEKEKRASELMIANDKLEFQRIEKAKLTAELIIANYTRSLIEASRDPLFTISLDGLITDTNAAGVVVTEVTRENLIGSNFISYFTEQEKAKQGYEMIFSKGFVTDYPLTIRDGKLTDVLFNGSVYKDKDGNVVGAVVVARDITDQKRIEKEFIEARIFAELATKIAEDAKTKAESATLIAQNAVKSKQQFLSNMSHEIRTPMNAIIGFTKVLIKTNLTAKQKEYLTAIKMSGDALIVLINDILDLAKVDSGKMTFEQSPFKMELSISAIIHLFEPKIQEKNLQLVKEYDFKIPDVLVGDAVRLHQILINLISNAVKFTNSGKIKVSVKLLEEDDQKVTIEFKVKDTGIGIPDEKIEKIFENFQQASSGTSRLYGGTGLGLAIVKQLVESQEGSIEVESNVGLGSTFKFVLNFDKTNEKIESEIALRELSTDKKNIKVLVVEDIVLNQLLMKTILDDFGFECDLSANGKLAIEKLSSISYDIILMDLQMPEMNGFEATEYIRNTLNLDIPIIALTADVTTVDVAKCKAVGMNDYLSKPIDERLLYNKILSFTKKDQVPKPSTLSNIAADKQTSVRYINLEYLNHRTKSNPQLISEMIQAYLDQTPTLISEMKIHFNTKNWNHLYATVHKMLPSFSIMGIHADFENMARSIQDFAKSQQETINIHKMVEQLEQVCLQVCKELAEELIVYKNQKNG